MIINTKFDLGQRVYIIVLAGENKFVTCEHCHGVGKITQGSATFKCSSCYGSGGKYECVNNIWKNNLKKVKIGRISTEYYREVFHKSYQDSIKYMMDETGVGSGSLFDEQNIFATEKEALEECKKRNEKLIK